MTKLLFPRLGVWALAVLSLSACSVVERVATRTPPPVPLQDPVAWAPAWQQQVPGGFAATTTVWGRGGQWQVVSAQGQWLRIQAQDGATLASASPAGPSQSGVGSDGRYSAYVAGGQVIARREGQEIWRQPISGRVMTPPFVSGERVFVMNTDRSITAWDVLDGRRLWVFKRPSDALTLSAPGVLTTGNGALLAGQGGRLAALEPTQGQWLGELALAAPRGTNEIERLADLIGPVARQDDLLCARAYQYAVGCIQVQGGRLAWTQALSGALPAVIVGQRVVSAQDNGRLQAWALASGEAAWQVDAFTGTGLTALAGQGPWLITGDARGQIHLLDEQGRVRARLSTGSSPVVAVGLQDRHALVLTQAGRLLGLQLP